MTPISYLATVLQAIPARWRTALYSAYSLACVAVSVLALVGVTAVGPVTGDEATEVLVFLAPVFGLTAVVNIDRRRRKQEPGDDYDVIDEPGDYDTDLPAADDSGLPGEWTGQGR